MPRQTRKVQSNINKIIILVILGIALASVTPVLADYLGPNRTVTETHTSCKIVLNSCQLIASKGTYKFHQSNTWSCSNEGKPWQSYPSKPPSQGCTSTNVGDKYWEKVQSTSQVTTTYPAATISGVLLNCVQKNGWCTTAPQLSLNGNEPVPGYTILGLEGTWNGQNFACPGASCAIPLAEGTNNFTYWALSSFTDTSTMGTLSARVDSQQPVISGSLSGPSGLNSWYTGPVVFTGSASDATSGLSGFSCTLDGIALGSCNSITINNEGPHTLVLKAQDNAGQVRILSQNASVDTQNPSLNVSLVGTRGSNTNWYTAAVLNGSASDPLPGSGLSVFEYSLDAGSWTSFPASGELILPDGKHTIDVRATDVAGHSVTSSKSYWLDHTAPSLSVDPAGTAGANGWYISNLNLTASASDETSGLNTFEYSLNNNSWTAYTSPLILSDGEHNISFWAEDEAGLVTQVNNSYKVDTHEPVIGGNLSGISGQNGWFISDVTLSGSAFDPWPGSGLDAFTYTLDDDQAKAYTDPLLLTDGQHTVKLDAQDNAGLYHRMEQTLKVDTLPPSISLKSTLPDWVKDTITLDGTAGDDGSGLTKVEISVDGGQSWESVTGSDSWNYLWNTLNSPNGPHDVLVRAFDEAGLNTQQTLHIGVDNSTPSIYLPASWKQWDTVTLDIVDEDSGLSETHLEISDPEGRWPTRIISLDSAQFPMQFKWDRRFGDDSIAPAGKYDVKIIASDQVGNSSTKTASITVLIGVLPPGPAATPLPPVHSSPTPTVRSTATVVPINTPTQSVLVQTFGSTPVPGVSATPQPQSTSNVRATPTQYSVLDQFQSMFAPPPNSVESTTTIGSLEVSEIASEATHPTGSNVLWGATAAAVIGSLTAYALEEKRKQEEAKADREAREAREEERHQKIQAQRTERLEAERAQERVWEEAREAEEQQKQQPDPGYQDLMAKRMDQRDTDDDVKWQASQKVIQEREEEKRQEEEKKKAKEHQAALAASYAAILQKEQESPQQEPNWWEQTKSFIGTNIIEPVNEYIYEPYIKPAVALDQQLTTGIAEWANENIYQPAIKPAFENTQQLIKNDTAWLNDNIYRPYIAPTIEKSSQLLSSEFSQIKEEVYQPYIKPVVEKSTQFVKNEIGWLNDNIYLPYIQPAVQKTEQFLISETSWINENIYQPYVKPIVDPIAEKAENYTSWIDQNIYQPIFAPVVNDINKYIYTPLADKTEEWWDKYGEWVHGALDAAGFIPGLGEIADGLNGLVYLGEGRYIEASVSALAMIPILGDLGKAGKWGLELGAEVLEEATEKAAKEIAEELIEKSLKEGLEEATEKLTEEAIEELAEKTIKDELVETIENTSEELIDATAKETLEAATEKQVVKETLDRADQTTFINTLRDQYGDEMVDRFLPFCEKHNIDPYDVLTRPPAEGQTLIGWSLGIESPVNPANHSIINLNVTTEELDGILMNSTVRPDSKVVVLGYGKDCEIPYFRLSDQIDGCHLSLSDEIWAPFNEARANFLSDINIPFIEKGLDERKIFIFNIDKKVIENPLNIERFSLPELRLIEMEENNYAQVAVGKFTAYVPVEKLDTFQSDLHPSLFK